MKPFRIFLRSVLFACVAALSACAADQVSCVRPILHFTGDSIIETWDLDRCFPDYHTVNHGIGGSGVKYIEEQAGDFTGCVVVVMSGTNDIQWKSLDRLKEYAAQYLDAIKALDAERIFLISLLPRVGNSNADDCEMNARIVAFNDIMRHEATKIPGCVYVDVHDLFLSPDGSAPVDHSLFYDGLHPSPKGFQILSNALLNALLNPPQN